MQVRSISPAELNRFAAVGPHTLGVDGLSQYIRELWESGSSKPERCFVVESGDQFIGRIAYRGRGEEINFTALYLPWDDDYLSVGKLLLHESLSGLRKGGITRLESFVTSEWPHAAQVQTLFGHIGLPLVQEKVRYEWNDDGQPITLRHNLMYRSLSEVGDAAFTEAIRRVSVGTLDRLDQLQVPALGADAHAREYFKLLKDEFNHHREWWWLAYNPSGELVGHVVGVPFNQGGSIGYIGIVPEQRGHGYIHDVLAKGMQVMFESGLTSFVCDTDVLNHPMRRAFEQRGFHQRGTVWAYHGDVDILTLDALT